MYKGVQIKANRDRIHTEAYDKSPWDARSSNQRFNDENTDISNIMYQSIIMQRNKEAQSAE